MSTDNKYTKLAANTLIFAIGSFSSKILAILLTRFYTSVLTTAEYGEADLITGAGNLIAPIAMLAINEAVIRFVMDKSADRRQVFTAGLVTTLGGALVLLCCLPLLGMMGTLSGHTLLIFFFVLSNNLRGLCASFSRGSGYVRLYAFDGVIATLTTIIFNVLFLVVFRMGVVGLVAGTIAANCLSVLFYFWAARLHRFIRPGSLKKDVFAAMYRYCIPLIPTTLFWWITNTSDKYMIEYFCGLDLTGLYAAAIKIPNLLTMASAIFYQAWLLSAVSEYEDPDERNRFYSRVTQTYFSIVFLLGMGILLLTKPAMYLLVHPDYFTAYEYVPLLLGSEVFSTFVTFLGAFYAAAKKNIMVPITILMGALVNIGLNLWLIPIHGPQGAAFATLMSYLVVFIVRFVDVQRFVKVKVSYPVMLLSCLLLGVQGYLVFRPGWQPYAIQAALVIVMLAVNLKHLMPMIRVVLGQVSGYFTR